MKENVTLLQEINELRTEVHSLKVKLKQYGAAHELKMGSTGRGDMQEGMASMRSRPEVEMPQTDLQREQ